MTVEHDAIKRGRGKWGQPGVPHKGWECVGEYDTFEEIGEDEFQTCGMCESAQVRFVHIMRNERYKEQLLCGCICAGHMGQDLAAAEVRDQAMRAIAGRRDHFPKRKRWKTSAKGNPFIKVGGYHVMVYRRKDGSYGVGATPPGASGPIWGNKRYTMLEHAQKGCFDAIRYLELDDKED